MFLPFLSLTLQSGYAAAITTRSQACFNDPFTTCFAAPVGVGKGVGSSISHSIDAVQPDRAFHVSASGSAVADEYDHFSLTASAGSSISWADPFGFSSYATGQSSAAFQDTITASGATGAGTLRLLWQISGTNSIAWSASGPMIDVGGDIALDVTCASSVRASGRVYDCGRGGPNPNDPGYQPWFSTTTSGAVNGAVWAELPIVFGQAVDTYVSFGLSAKLGLTSETCEGCIAALDGFSRADFGSTGRLRGVQLLDASGNLLDLSNIESASGFRYDLVGAAAAVPEPVTTGTSLLGLGALLLLSRPALRKR
jgi:hypothetical protein